VVVESATDVHVAALPEVEPPVLAQEVAPEVTAPPVPIEEGKAIALMEERRGEEKSQGGMLDSPVPIPAPMLHGVAVAFQPIRTSPISPADEVFQRFAGSIVFPMTDFAQVSPVASTNSPSADPVPAEQPAHLTCSSTLLSTVV
jgi:hypothetical protein